MDSVATLPPGVGTLDLGIAANEAEAGGYLEYRHHLRKDLSAFARGEVMYDLGLDKWRGAVLAGVRWHFNWP